MAQRDPRNLRWESKNWVREIQGIWCPRLFFFWRSYQFPLMFGLLLSCLTLIIAYNQVHCLCVCVCVCVCVVVVVESVMDNTLGYLWSIFRVNEFWKILLEKWGRTDEDTRCCVKIFGEWNFEGLRREESEASIVKAMAQPRALLWALHFIDMNSADKDPRHMGQTGQESLSPFLEALGASSCTRYTCVWQT